MSEEYKLPPGAYGEGSATREQDLPLAQKTDVRLQEIKRRMEEESPTIAQYRKDAALGRALRERWPGVTVAIIEDIVARASVVVLFHEEGKHLGNSINGLREELARLRGKD